jgi:arylsulfatase A-like enzyme
VTGATARWWGLLAMWTLLVVVPDLVLGRFGLKHLGVMGAAFLPAAFAASMTAWALVAIAVSRLQARPRGAWLSVPIVVLLTATVPFLVLAVERYRTIMGVDPPASAAAFLFKSPRYAVAIMREAYAPVAGILFLLATVALFGALRWGTRRPLTSPIGETRTRFLGGALAFALALALAFPRLPLPPDLHAVRALIQGAWLPSASNARLPIHLARPDLARVARDPAARAVHVVVFLHESVSSSAWAPWNSVADGSALASFFARHPDRSIVYPDASPAATCTDVSLPSLFTGLDADATSDAYRRAPLLWQEAKAAGYRTALYSAQDFDWAGFREFFLGRERPDTVKTASDYREPRPTVDHGIDDRLVVDDAILAIEAHAKSKEQPFFMVVHFNATHAPCWLPEEGPESGRARATQSTSGVSSGFGDRISSARTRCLAAAAFVAEQNARVLEALERTGLLADTLVVGTSDHGETFRDDRPTRIENYYEDVLHVPLYLILPDAIVKDAPALAEVARENRSRHVGNVDLFPTVLDVLGRMPPAAPNERPPLGGVSLLRPIGQERVLIVSNTNDIRSWSRDGFALYDGSYKWLVDEYEGARLFDLTADPGETHDLSREAPTGPLDVLRAESRARPHMARLLAEVFPRLYQ